jgi:hypothetical protein
LAAKRKNRHFAYANPKNGWVALWEDGSWSDILLAQYLSKKLDTKVIWLLMSSVTDSWGFIIFEKGEEKQRKYYTRGDPYEGAEKFAKKNRLPYYLEYLSEPEELYKNTSKPFPKPKAPKELQKEVDRLRKEWDEAPTDVIEVEVISPSKASAVKVPGLEKKLHQFTVKIAQIK